MSDQDVSSSKSRGLSRLQLFTAGIAGLLGLGASPVLSSLATAQAAAADNEASFAATGPGSVGFDASATNSGTPVFNDGVATNGTHAGVTASGGSFGVLAKSAGVGVRGGGDANTTGVQGISFTDATEQSHGSGVGVQGNSGIGLGVAGYSDYSTGVYGNGGGVSGVGVFGEGSTGVSGSSPIGIAVQGASKNGTGLVGESTAGIGLVARSAESWAITAESSSGSLPAIYGRNTGKTTGGGGVQGASGHSFGVLGTSSAKPTTYATGVGVAGQHVNGYGTGVAGYSLSEKSAAAETPVPQSTGVFGAGDATGVLGLSPHGDGIKGVSMGKGVGVSGVSFATNSETKYGAGTGVQGNSGSGSAVAGFSETGTGIYGQSKGTGVAGHGSTGVSGSSTTGSGVVGHTEMGAGVKGDAKSGIGVVATAGHSQPATYSVNTGAGPGLSSTSRHGYGAELEGGKAALRLIPLGHKGHPDTGEHLTGELVVDEAGDLYLCMKSGSPGTWKRVLLA